MSRVVSYWNFSVILIVYFILHTYPLTVYLDIEYCLHFGTFLSHVMMFHKNSGIAKIFKKFLKTARIFMRQNLRDSTQLFFILNRIFLCVQVQILFFIKQKPTKHFKHHKKKTNKLSIILSLVQLYFHFCMHFSVKFINNSWNKRKQ